MSEPTSHTRLTYYVRKTDGELASIADEASKHYLGKYAQYVYASRVYDRGMCFWLRQGDNRYVLEIGWGQGQVVVDAWYPPDTARIIWEVSRRMVDAEVRKWLHR